MKQRFTSGLTAHPMLFNGPGIAADRQRRRNHRSVASFPVSRHLPVMSKKTQPAGLGHWAEKEAADIERVDNGYLNLPPPYPLPSAEGLRLEAIGMTEDLIPTIVIDTREPVDGGWEPYFTVPVVRQTLQTGDFSLLGCEDMVAIERKTTDDLLNCFCSSRKRFTKELQRFQAIPSRWVIVEGNYKGLLAGDFRSRMTSRSAWESCVAMMVRFQIPILMADNARTAAALCESILTRWFREHWRVLDEARKAVKKLERQVAQSPFHQ